MSLDTDSPRPRCSSWPGDTPVIEPGNRKSALPVETETSANAKTYFHGIFMAKLEQFFKTGSFGRFFYWSQVCCLLSWRGIRFWRCIRTAPKF